MNRKTLARHRFQRTSAEGGGGANSTTITVPAGQTTIAGTTTNPPPANTGPEEAVGEDGARLGFPKETPVDQMNADQRANYWRHESKKQQKRVPSNLEQIQADAAAWAEYQRTQKPADEQVADRIREETRTATLKEAAEKSAVANLRVVLQTRGKSPEEINELVEFSNTSVLVKDGEVDTTKVMALADKLAPAGEAGGGGYGQGRGYQSGGTSKRELGQAEADRRFGNKQQQDPHRGSLGGLRR